MNLNSKNGVYSMTTTQKWGNSLGVRLPFKLAEKYGLVNGSKVNLIEGENEIIIKPVKQRPTLDGLLEKCEGENPHEEFFSIPVGREEI